MKNRYRKFRRGNVWWCQDNQTGKQQSLKTKDEPEAIELLIAMNNSRLPLWVNPIAYHLNKIDWAIFGTGSFQNDFLARDNSTAEQQRQKELFRVIGGACAKHGLRTRRLLVYGKTEWGNNRRGHYNFLIGKHGTESVSPSELAATIQTMWTDRRGEAVIEPFRQNLHEEGILYQSKYELDTKGNRLTITEVFSPMLEKVIKRNADIQSSDSVPLFSS